MSVIGLKGPGNKSDAVSRLDGEMVELSLLLPSWQAAALETAAQDQGLTTAQMVRCLIRDFFDHLHAFGPMGEGTRLDTPAGPGA